MEPSNVRAIVTAAREVSHATCNLTAVTALIAKSYAASVRAGERAMDAGMRATKVAFDLDDIYRRNNGSEPSLEAAEHAMETALAAIQAAREAIRSARNASPSPTGPSHEHMSLTARPAGGAD